jgi:hypothetical protein
MLYEIAGKYVDAHGASFSTFAYQSLYHDLRRYAYGSITPFSIPSRHFLTKKFTDEGGLPAAVPLDQYSDKIPDPIESGPGRTDRDRACAAAGPVVHKALQALSPTQRAVISSRFGLQGHQEASCHEVAAKLKVSRQAVNAAERRAIEELRRVLGNDENCKALLDSL